MALGAEQARRLAFCSETGSKSAGHATAARALTAQRWFVRAAAIAARANHVRSHDFSSTRTMAERCWFGDEEQRARDAATAGRDQQYGRTRLRRASRQMFGWEEC
jgi:hypothetical protein